MWPSHFLSSTEGWRRRWWHPTPVLLPGKIPWAEEPGGLQSMGSLRVGHDWATSLSLFTFMHWKGNGNPFQYSCLENPRDRGAWQAAVYGVAQSQTRLKRLSSSSSNRGVTEDKTVGWHHWLNGHEFEQTPGDSEDREVWHVAVHRVSKSQTCLTNWTTFSEGEQDNWLNGPG